MKISAILIIFLLSGILVACSNSAEEKIVPQEQVNEPVSETSTLKDDTAASINNSDSNNARDEDSAPLKNYSTTDNSENTLQEIKTEPAIDDCAPKIYVYVHNLSESPSGYGAISISESNMIYELAYSTDGLFSVEKLLKKNNPPLLRIYIPTGIFTPKNPIKIDDHLAIRIINKTYARVNKQYHNETLFFELYNLSKECIFPAFETTPLVVVRCWSTSSTGDCIGSRYDEYQIMVSAWNEYNQTPFNLTVSIDGGEPLISTGTNSVSNLFGTVSGLYRMPPYTFDPGTHKIKVIIEADNKILSVQYSDLLILPDDKVSVREFNRAYICDTADTGDFIRYYDYSDEPDSIILKHNYYPGNLTLKKGSCVTTTTGFDVCDDGETFSELYNHKILRLVGARSVCPWISDIPDNCKVKEILEIGDSFEDRFREEYELVKIYNTPKVVLFKNLNKEWLIYYPYDVNVPYSGEIMIESVNGDSVTVSRVDQCR